MANRPVARLATLSEATFRYFDRPQLELAAGAVKAQLARPTGEQEWVAVCKAIRLFVNTPTVPEDFKAKMKRELSSTLAKNFHQLTEMQLGCTLELVNDLWRGGPPAGPPHSPLASPTGRGAVRGGAPPATANGSAASSRPAAPKASAAAADPPAAAPPARVANGLPAGPIEVLDTYKDNSCSDRCQCIVNGVNRALAKGEICCLLTGETFLSAATYNTHAFSKKNVSLQKCNPQISLAPPSEEAMHTAGEVCKAFLEAMRPVNTYVDHYVAMLKADYEYERSHLLRRLSYNDEWDRFRLENEGLSYFGMKMSGGGQRNNDTFAKADGKPLPYSYAIAPGQTVWVSAEDAVVVDPVDKRITGTAEVASIGRESISLRGLTALPTSKSGLYRIDLAVTEVNLERMLYAVGLIRLYHELDVIRSNPKFKAHVPINEGDKDCRPEDLGFLEPGGALARALFHNIHHSLATARDRYRQQFGAVPPPGLPERPRGFNSYDPPPKAVDGLPLTLEELNHAAQQPHPRLRAANCVPLDCTTRPLHRSQHWLNPNQMHAMAKVMDEGRQVTLVQGPPGTGKTTTAIAIICEWVMWYHCKILATAHSNKGVDNLLQGLVAKGIKVLRVGRGGPSEGTDLGEYSLETLVDRHPMNAHREQLQQQLKALQKPGQSAGNNPQIRELTNQIGNMTKVSIGRQIVKEAEVVCATCVGVGSPMLQGLQFDFVLVDEATQAVEPSVLIPITRGAKQLVMIGDQAQLPPTCKCPETLMMGLDISLFDRLIGNGLEPHVLDTQYRMHPTISCFPSWRFYKSILLDGISAHDRPLPPGVFPTPDSRVCFLEADGHEEQVNTSKLNRAEANCITWAVTQLMNLGGVALSQVGVITPYAAQVRIIMQTVRGAFGDGASELEVHSVDGFQGREKDFIILSMVRTKQGGDLSFITDWRRTNVALTRAKYGVIVVGSAMALSQSSIWLAWLKFHQRHLLRWDSYHHQLQPIQPDVLQHLQSLPSPAEEECQLHDVLARKVAQQQQLPEQLPPAAPEGAPGYAVSPHDMYGAMPMPTSGPAMDGSWAAWGPGGAGPYP
eukprot:EG_transcript_1409